MFLYGSSLSLMKSFYISLWFLLCFRVDSVHDLQTLSVSLWFQLLLWWFINFSVV